MFVISFITSSIQEEFLKKDSFLSSLYSCCSSRIWMNSIYFYRLIHCNRCFCLNNKRLCSQKYYDYLNIMCLTCSLSKEIEALEMDQLMFKMCLLLFSAIYNYNWDGSCYCVNSNYHYLLHYFIIILFPNNNKIDFFFV